MSLKKIIFIILAVFLFGAAALNGGSNGRLSGGAQLLNDRGEQIVGADLLSSPGFVTPGGLTGRGQVVAVADSGIDKGSTGDIHPDLAGDAGQIPRVIMLKSWAGRSLADDPVGHGTHMVGTIAGSGSSSGGKFKGLAPEARIYFQGILDQSGQVAPPSDLDQLFLPAYQAGARIHVDAWGSGSNLYSGSAMKADAFMRRYPGFLAIFGAGNGGAKSLTSEANSKNALVVGSSVSPRPALDFSPGGTLDTADFSSRGPAGDGRIKPDLLAPGTSIISTRSSLVKGNLPGFPMYTRMQGSSMASAVAAGSTALLREYMQRYMSIPEPRSSSLKAALINGARTPEDGPSQDGFGVLDLAGTVLALKDQTMVLAEETQGLTRGGTKKYSHRVEDATSPLKVTLAWTDPAGEPSSPRALVNNLDLTVTAPDGRKYPGNGFLEATPDAVNNVEQVYINNPQPGEYTIEVTATSVGGPAAGGTTYAVQDYSLVYGQPLGTGIISAVAGGGVLELFGGQRVDLAGKETHYSFNGKAVARLNPEPGYRIYFSGRSVYLAGRLWRPESAQAKESAGGRIWFEADQDALEGGYHQNPQAPPGLTVNGSYRKDISGLPPGIGLTATLDGVTQTLWSVFSNFRTLGGNVDQVAPGDNGSITSIELFNDSREYQVSRGAGYIYKDNFERSDPLEMVFGSGNLDGLMKIMPGQQVTLIMPPLSRVVNSVLVDRNIVSGYVTRVNSGESRLNIGENPAFNVIAGTGVQKDRKPSSLKNVQQGDYAVAVIIPGTREVLGLAVYSNVAYGRVLFTSDRDNSVYLSDFQNRFQMYKLSPGTEVRRWGLSTDASTLTSGTWVRVTLSPDGSEVWRMDVAELLEDDRDVLASVDPPFIITAGGEKYRVSETFTPVTKEGLPVTAGDLLPGEKVTVVSLLAPPPYNKVPVAIRASVREGSRKPVFMAAVRLEDGDGRQKAGQYTLAGYTSGDRLYLWHENGDREDIPLDNNGAFSLQLKPLEKETAVRVVAVDKSGGAVAGKTLSLPADTAGIFKDTAGHWAGESIDFASAGGIMAGYEDGCFRPDQPISRYELAMVRAGLTGITAPLGGAYTFSDEGDLGGTISRASFLAYLKEFFQKAHHPPPNYRPAFRDCQSLAAPAREAVAWAGSWGIVRGRSPDTFGPHDPLTRSEAAAIIQNIFEKLASTK